MKNEIKESIGLVKCGDRFGTAFLLNNTTAITAYHVIADHINGHSISVQFPSSKTTFEATHINVDEKYNRLDVAILSIKGDITATKFLEPVIKQLNIKQKWTSRGYPLTKGELGENLISDSNIINQIFDSPQRGKFDIQLDLSLKFDTYEGLSGAPLIVDEQIVGLINTQFDQNGKARELYALSLKYFKELLEDNGITVKAFHEKPILGDPGYPFSKEIKTKEKPIENDFLLILTLMNAISRTDDSAREKIDSARQSDENWISKTRFISPARKYIDESFFAIFGVQRLIEIGKDVRLNRDSKTIETYLDHLTLLTRRMLRFSCFILLSELWNHSDKKVVVYNEKQRNDLNIFFDDLFDADIYADFELLSSLLNIFHEHKLTYPIAELSDFRSNIESKDLLVSAIHFLKDLDDQSAREHTFEYCREMEREFCVFLSNFWFLTRYQMISVKGLRYDKMHKDEGYFIHKYYQLVPKNTSPDTRGYESQTITTDSIIVYENDYKQGLNLFPFLIDLNALMFEEQSKIYFYDKFDSTNNCIHYSFIDDPEVNQQIPQNDLELYVDLNTIVKDKTKHQQYKLQKVHTLFQLARNTILGYIS